jgi:hypothetical protein
MTRRGWRMIFGAGLLAVFVPACSHPAAVALRSTGETPSAPGRVTAVARGPSAPTETRQPDENQSPPPAPVAQSSPSPDPGSLLTAPPEQVTGKPRPRPPARGLLASDPPSLLTPGSAPEPPGGAPAPPPVPVAEPGPALNADEPIVLALRSFLNNKADEARAHLQREDPATQETLRCLTAAVARLAKKPLDQLSPEEVVALQDELKKSQLALRPRAPLVIDKMCFCEWIKDYGVYKPLPEGYEFQPKVNDRPGESVQVYVELRNLASQPRGNGYETVLHSTIKIYDSDNKEIFMRNYPGREGPFRTLTPLPDFYKGYNFFVPTMPPGRYTLTIEVRDVTRPDQPRTASRSLEFRVAVPG